MDDSVLNSDAVASRAENAWHAANAEDVLASLGAKASGLLPEEVADRLRLHGRNDLPIAKGRRAAIATPANAAMARRTGRARAMDGSLSGGWKLGNTIDGCQAEFVLVPHAMANLARVPDDLTDEQVLMCPDIMSTGFAGAESGGTKIGDMVAVFAQGPIGLCATAGAKLMGASKIIAVDRLPERLDMARRLGADHLVDFSRVDPVEEILRVTDGRGVDVAIEALGTQATFEACLRVLRPGGTLSSLGVYSSDLKISLGAFAAGLGDHKIVTTLCPGGKERMRRLMSIIESGRVDLGAMVTHRFKLDDIEDAYEMFANQRDRVFKVAITP